MSSMTLKEFMTRGNGGMEKRGWGVNPDYVAGYNDFWTKNGDPAGNGKALSDLLIGMLIQFGPDLLEGGERGAAAEKKIATLPFGQKIVSMAKGALNKIPRTLRSMVASNPELYKSWVVRPVVRGINKEAPLFSEEQLKSLNNFDMWQHTPGMAAAFGIPFGIGAILGKPGWGALLGLLGAGGYGYYQYHKMKGDQVDTYNKLKENQALEQEEDAREEAENAKAQEYEDKVKEQSTPKTTNALPAPSDAETTDSEVPTTTTQTTPNPVQPVIDPGQAGDDEDLGLDALDTDLNATPEQSRPSTPTNQAKPVASQARPKNQFAAVKTPTPPQIVPDFSTPPKKQDYGLTPEATAVIDAGLKAFNQPQRDEITRQRNMQLYGSPTAPAGANTPISLGQKPIPVIKPVG